MSLNYIRGGTFDRRQNKHRAFELLSRLVVCCTNVSTGSVHYILEKSGGTHSIVTFSCPGMV